MSRYVQYKACLLIGMAAVIAGTPVSAQDSGGAAPTVEEARAALKQAAKAEREKFRSMTFEEFKAKVYKEPFEGGKYIINGDTAILDEKHLREFFEKNIQAEPEALEGLELIVHQVGGLDAAWNSVDRANITYCVSTAFGTRYQKVVADMEAVTEAWEAVADVDFRHVPGEDARCNASNAAVVFDVRPVDVGGEYLARAFFPNEPRRSRNVLIDETSFQLTPGRKLQLAGILRHELGHTLGFRHEHTRPESGACFEDDDWRPLTDYDPFSVMHYPQCNGLGDWSLTLTSLDSSGAACLYGPAQNFAFDPGVCPDGGGGGGGPTPIPGVTQTQSFAGQSVDRGEEKQYGPFSVVPGTMFTAVMGGSGASGDPDLYVRFKAEPLRAMYDCRPYLLGAEEQCALDVPEGQARAFVMVHGFSAGTFGLTVTHTPSAN